MPFLLGEFIVVIMSSYHWLQHAHGAGTVFCPLTTAPGWGSMMSVPLSSFPRWGSGLEVVKISQLMLEAEHKPVFVCFQSLCWPHVFYSDIAEWCDQVRFSFSSLCRALLNSQKTRNCCSQETAVHSSPRKASKELTDRHSQVPRLSAITWLLPACVLGWRGYQLVPALFENVSVNSN